jgi:hypothetical protein
MTAASTIFAFAPAFLLVGCQASKPAEQPEKIDPSVWRSPHADIVQHDQPTPVMQGSLPLVYQMQTAGRIRVMDVTEGGQVASGPVASQAIVRVTPRGVYVGDDMLAPGPLMADHQYRIILEAPPKPAGAQ